MARISLCTIARDEERFLGDCLASVRGVADEIVVVDTGSTDDTRAIARAAGARVLAIEWADDFAAARNTALDAATGTHVIVLDADERLARDAGSVLRRAAEDRTLAIGMLPLHDATALDAREDEILSGAKRIAPPAWLPRFFVKHDALRFRRRVHETVMLDAERALDATGGRIAAVDAPIVHYGEVREHRAAKGKRARNVRLLERALADDPEDGEISGYLAMELARGGDLARAEAIASEHLDRFLARIDALPPRALRPAPVQIAQVLAACRLARGDARSALAAAESALARCVEPHPNLLFLAGGAHERLGDARAAETAYRACLALDGRRFTIPVDAQFTSGAPRLRLAALALAEGRASEALDLLAELGGALDLPARLLRAEARLAGRDAASALRELAPLMASAASKELPPDFFALAARASELSGAPDPALAAAALRAAPASWIEPRRRALVRGA